MRVLIQTWEYKKLIFISFIVTISGVDTTEEVPSSLLLSEQMVSECVVDSLYNLCSFAVLDYWYVYSYKLNLLHVNVFTGIGQGSRLLLL